MPCTHHTQWRFIVSGQRWLNPRYGMTHEGPVWGQLLLFQFGICPHGISAWLSGFTLRTAHFVYAFMECVLTTDFPYVFIPGFLNGGSIDLLDWMILWGGCWELFGSLRAFLCSVGWLAGLHTLDTRSTCLQLWQSKLCPGIVKYSLGDKIASSWEPLVSTAHQLWMFGLCKILLSSITILKKHMLVYHLYIFRLPNNWEHCTSNCWIGAIISGKFL